MLSDFWFKLERIWCFPVTYMCVIIDVLGVFVGGLVLWDQLVLGVNLSCRYHDSDANSSKSTVHRSGGSWAGVPGFDPRLRHTKYIIKILGPTRLLGPTDLKAISVLAVPTCFKALFLEINLIHSITIIYIVCLLRRTIIQRNVDAYKTWVFRCWSNFRCWIVKRTEAVGQYLLVQWITLYFVGQATTRRC